MLDDGMPMLSTMVTISRPGITWRIAASILAKRLAVSSTRVPTGTRAWISTWPESTDGKKLLPRKGTSRKDSATTAMKPIRKGRRCAIACCRMPL
jgi:hypothetical protein